MIIICQKYDNILNSEEIGIARVEEDKVRRKYNIVIKLRGENTPIVAATYETEKEAKEHLVKMAGALYNDARVYRFFRPFDGDEEAKGKASINLSRGMTV